MQLGLFVFIRTDDISVVQVTAIVKKATNSFHIDFHGHEHPADIRVVDYGDGRG